MLNSATKRNIKVSILEVLVGIKTCVRCHFKDTDLGKKSLEDESFKLTRKQLNRHLKCTNHNSMLDSFICELNYYVWFPSTTGQVFLRLI